jgi:hypothetical protein
MVAKIGQALVAYIYNPSYSGGREQEGCGLKPPQGNRSQDLILKIPILKRAGGVAQGVDPEFKPSTTRKQKNRL